MLDETSNNDTMDLDEMVDAFDVIKNVDVLAFDACESQWVEMAAELKNYADVLVASQEWTWYGFDYAEAISALRENPLMSAEQLGIEMVESVASSYGDPMVSAVTLGPELDDLIEAIDEWAIALLAGMDTWHSDYVNARDATQHFSYGYGELWDTNRDLYDAAKKIKQRVTDADIQTKCQAVMDAVSAVVLHEWNNPAMPEYDDAHGLSIYWPEDQEELDMDFDYYKDKVGFSTKTNWDEFCEAYVGSS